MSRFVIAIGKTKYRVFALLRFAIRLILHIEIPADVYRNGIRLPHPYNIIIHPNSRVGRNVTIYHCVTLGKRFVGTKPGAPVIGDNVTIYPRAIVIGMVHVCNNSIVWGGARLSHKKQLGTVVQSRVPKIMAKIPSI